MRSTGHNAFAALLDAAPGSPHPCVCEIHCSSVLVEDRRAFNELTRSLPKADVDAIVGASSGAREAGGFLRVDVALGRFCLASRTWGGCTLRHPSAPTPCVVE